MASPEPWPEPVNGADVLSEAAEMFSRFIVLPDGAADALALWAAIHIASTCSNAPRV